MHIESLTYCQVSLWNLHYILIRIGRMYKGSKKLDESSVNKSVLSTSALSQSNNQVIEREIDNYTRILEQDKRKFFRVQENRNDVLKEYNHKMKELESLKSKQFKTDMIKKKGEVKILQRQLEQSIASYNQALASNNRLKNEIDELRKEKKNQNQAFKTLTDKLAGIHTLIKEKKEQILEKKDNIEAAKSQIIKIRLENESEMKSFREEVNAIQGNFGESNNKSFQKKKSDAELKTQTIDTQPLVKLRLKNLINKNKEKIKVIDAYKKTMQSIWKSFEEIKLESGIADLQEITTTFLKHEEQNLFLYQYINKLNKEIEQLSEANSDLAGKISLQKQVNDNYLKDISGSPQKEMNKQAVNEFLTEKFKKVHHFESFLKEIEPSAKQVLIALGLPSQISLSQVNIEQYLSEIQTGINLHFAQDEPSKCYYKEEITKYTKMAPTINDDIKENKEERILQAEKLREYAADYWEKRKGKLKSAEE